MKSYRRYKHVKKIHGKKHKYYFGRFAPYPYSHIQEMKSFKALIKLKRKYATHLKISNITDLFHTTGRKELISAAIAYTMLCKINETAMKRSGQTDLAGATYRFGG